MKNRARDKLEEEKMIQEKLNAQLKHVKKEVEKLSIVKEQIEAHSKDFQKFEVNLLNNSRCF